MEKGGGRKKGWDGFVREQKIEGKMKKEGVANRGRMELDGARSGRGRGKER